MTSPRGTPPRLRLEQRDVVLGILCHLARCVVAYSFRPTEGAPCIKPRTRPCRPVVNNFDGLCVDNKTRKRPHAHMPIGITNTRRATVYQTPTRISPHSLVVDAGAPSLGTLDKALPRTNMIGDFAHAEGARGLEGRRCRKIPSSGPSRGGGQAQMGLVKQFRVLIYDVYQC